MLYAAALNGQTAEVNALIEAHVDVNAADKDGFTPLLVAACVGHTEVVASLIKARARLDVTDKNERTALFIAAQEGHVAIVVLLLEAHAYVDSASSDGSTPLHIATFKGHIETVVVLMKYGADVNAADEFGYTPLITAACVGRVEAAAVLIHGGASLNAQTGRGQSLYDLACTFPQSVPGVTREAMLAMIDATACSERRLWLLRMREWLYVRERASGNHGRDLARYDPPRYRKCYGCGGTRPIDSPTATTCPRGCGDPAHRWPAADAWYQEVHEIWYCSSECVTEAAARHRPVCDQGLRWAAAAAAACDFAPLT